MSVFGQVRRAVLGIPLEQTLVSRRGFSVADEAARTRIERIGREFLCGYHAALEEGDGRSAADRIDARSDPEFRGFAFEGAAMALTLLDSFAPPAHRFHDFVAGPGNPHAYMCFVGAGWAVARLPWMRLRPALALRRLDPLLGWLAMDGFGFHEGYFHWPRRVTRAEVPRHLTGYQLRAFDQGLGRSLWFVNGADSTRIPRTIAAFAPGRHSDLWSGVGLACAYAGAAGPDVVRSLVTSAGPHQAAFAQGVAFAAKARRRAGNTVPHTETACAIACGMNAAEAAALCDETVGNLPRDGPAGARETPAYEVWRLRLQSELTSVRSKV